MKRETTAQQLSRNQIVQLAIPAACPIKTMDGNLHEAGQDYRVLGMCGTCIRLSRKSDNAKLIINAEAILTK